MKQSFSATSIKDRLQQKLLELSEQLVGGFQISDRVFPGLTVKGRRSMLAMLEQVVFYTIARTSPEKANVYDLLRQISKKILNGTLWRSQYSPKVGAENASEQFDDISFSESHMHKIREYGAALGVFLIEDRQFVRGEDGKFLPGQNKGKKYASWLEEINFERLALVACALIQSLKNEVVHGDEGLDAWETLKPRKGCALVALLWQKLGFKGSIFTPELEEDGITTAEAVYDQYLAAKSQAHKIDVLIYEQTQLAKQNEIEGRSMSPMFWQMVKRDRASLRDLKAKIGSLHRRLVQDFGLAIEKIVPTSDLPEFSDLAY